MLVKVSILGMLAALVLSGCVSSFPVAGATGNVGKKTGKASSYAILGLLPFGDSSAVTAARNGDIKTIGTIDQKISFYYVYTKITTIVTGE